MPSDHPSAEATSPLARFGPSYQFFAAMPPDENLAGPACGTACNDAPTIGRKCRLRSVAVAPAVASAHHSAGVTDGGSGHTDTSNSGPKRAAAIGDLGDHAVRLWN